MQNREPESRCWLVCVPSLSEVDRDSDLAQQSIESKCLDKMKDFMVRKLDQHKTYIANYPSCSWKQTYGGFRHLQRLDGNIVVFGKNLYMDLCSNLHAISEVHFVAAGSGAYLTSKMLEFLDHFGTQLHPEDFDSAWDSFISSDTKIKSAIFIAPSLPSPTGMLYFLGKSARPDFYNHMKLYAPNIRFFPVVKTHPELNFPRLDMELENQGHVLFASDMELLKTSLEERFQPLFHNKEIKPSF